MSVHLVTYADENMTASMSACTKSAYKFEVVDVTEFEPSMISEYFYSSNQHILSQDRGAGYWLWKPYCIDEIMFHLDDGDILIYSDAGVEFVNNVSHIINRMDEDIFFFTNGHRHVEWCKADVWVSINNPQKSYEHNDYEVYTHLKQVQASVIFFKVNQKTRDFVKEWLLWSQMPGFIDDSPSKLPNYPTFQEHRHDQAILTCLQIKYGYKLHWWPTQYSGHIRVEGDNYPIMFNHHRLRNNEYTKECV